MILNIEYTVSKNVVCRILVPEYGFVHLDLIPMLVGFFTYKIATFMQAIEDAVNAAAGKAET